jgi:hypothetical protein
VIDNALQFRAGGRFRPFSHRWKCYVHSRTHTQKVPVELLGISLTPTAVATSRFDAITLVGGALTLPWQFRPAQDAVLNGRALRTYRPRLLGSMSRLALASQIALLIPSSDDIAMQISLAVAVTW